MGKIKNYLKRILDEKVHVLRFIRRKKIKKTDFTIISNNCWAGNVYRYLGIPYATPTLGLYFWAPEYLKFVSNLKYYLSKELKFITYNESLYKNEIIAKNQCHVPIGKLEDVEIMFLHYKDESEAKEKWDRRASRINYDNIIIKFSEMNKCTNNELRSFDNLAFDNKIMFVKDKLHSYKCGIYYPGSESMYNLSNDTINWNKYVNITSLLNGDIMMNMGSKNEDLIL